MAIGKIGMETVSFFRREAFSRSPPADSPLCLLARMSLVAILSYNGNGVTLRTGWEWDQFPRDQWLHGGGAQEGRRAVGGAVGHQ